MIKKIIILIFVSTLLYAAGRNLTGFIRVAETEGAVLLSWKQSSTKEIKGFRLYRSTRPITSRSRLRKAVLLIEENNQIHRYLDIVPQAGSYYYAVIPILANGKPLYVFKDKINILKSSLTIKNVSPIITQAARISQIKATVRENKVFITFKSSQANRPLMLFRSTKPILSYTQLLNLEPIALARKATLFFIDTPPDANSTYFYTVYDALIFQKKIVTILPNHNTIAQGVRLSNALPNEKTSVNIPSPSNMPSDTNSLQASSGTQQSLPYPALLSMKDNINNIRPLEQPYAFKQSTSSPLSPKVGIKQNPIRPSTPAFLAPPSTKEMAVSPSLQTRVPSIQNKPLVYSPSSGQQKNIAPQSPFSPTTQQAPLTAQTPFSLNTQQAPLTTQTPFSPTTQQAPLTTQTPFSPNTRVPSIQNKPLVYSPSSGQQKNIASQSPFSPTTQQAPLTAQTPFSPNTQPAPLTTQTPFSPTTQQAPLTAQTPFSPTTQQAPLTAQTPFSPTTQQAPLSMDDLAYPPISQNLPSSSSATIIQPLTLPPMGIPKFSLYEKTSAKSPLQASAKYLLQSITADTENYTQAPQIYITSISPTSPSEIKTVNNIAKTFLARKQYSQAKNRLQTILNRENNQASLQFFNLAHFYLGQTEYFLGNYYAALSHFTSIQRGISFYKAKEQFINFLLHNYTKNIMQEITYGN